MSQMRYPHIFEPIRLGRQLFLNRLFAAPTGYRNMTYDSIYPEEALQYYRRKAMGGCAAVSTGELIVDTAMNLPGGVSREVLRHSQRAYAEVMLEEDLRLNSLPRLREAAVILLAMIQSHMGTLFGTVDFKVLPAEKNVGTVLREAFFRSVNTVKMIWESLFDLITGRYGMEAVSGPVGVTKALGEAAEQGTADLVYLAVVISMNLGVMNLLPLPALDGGRLVFQFIELIFRKPVRAEIEGYVHFAGLIALMILMVIVAVKDVIGLF